MKKLSWKAAILILTAAVLESSTMAGVAHGQMSHRDVEALSQASLIYIATVRKNGDQSTAAPVWFTTEPDGSVLIQTKVTTWKAKRIRRGSPVIVWMGKRDGPAFVGTAHITDDPEIIGRIVKDYPEKYWMARLGIHRPTPELFTEGQVVAIKINPVRDLPEGFTSAPGTPAPKVNSESGAGKT